MTETPDIRLIEAGFPCHQVGAETQREQSVGLQPPVNRLHVWWARRPLTPSRAAILASLLPAGTDPEAFVRQLGIERVQALVHGVPWTLTGKLLERVEPHAGQEVLPIDAVVLRALEAEQERRADNRRLIERLREQSPDLQRDPILARWEAECAPLPEMPFNLGDALPLQRIAADPAWANERIEFENAQKIRTAEDKYQYPRAYTNPVEYQPTGLTVLDPTAGGGSIPFEALRLGHRVIANDLNPVATTILHATLDYPARYGRSLLDEVDRWGQRMLTEMRRQIADLFPPSPIDESHRLRLQKLFEHDPKEGEAFLNEVLDAFLYVRQVTCPHCGGEAPLLNTCWLSKEAGDPWGVRVIAQTGKVRFETYRIKQGRGPHGEDPNAATVNRGVGQCVHCHQAVSGDEIKRQAQAAAKHPMPQADCPDGWQDRLYAVVAVRLEPKLDKHGQPERYGSGARKGEIKTRKIRYFRPPNQRDLDALAEAQRRLAERWDDWDAAGLIPTERLPDGDKTKEPQRYGMTRWCDLFTPRQLLGHLTLIETLNQLKADILAELGNERGRAVVTYLQFAIDKGVDYNSRQTRWHFSRGAVVGTFGRHDFSLKWTFGEMIFSGPSSGAAWGLSQVVDAYQGMAELMTSVHTETAGNPPLTISNGTGASLPHVADASVDLVCMDPPYYNNVQYAELSDFYYVWQRRTLRDLYPALFGRRLTDKDIEAVANPARDGSAKDAKATYERLMGDIFRECRRTLKDDGLFTLMFTHKSQDAWETLTRSLIDAGWIISACFPVESEGENSMHQRDLAAAASSIFIACRKRPTRPSDDLALWESAFGQLGVRHQIEAAVRQGLADFVPLKLNPVDEMVASYGKALQVLSTHWPVQDGDTLVSPLQAMNEASRIVSQSRVSQITGGKVRVEDLDSETAMALTIFGIWELGEVAYDDILNLSRSLGIELHANIQARDRASRIDTTTSTRGRAIQNQDDAARYNAPLVRTGSKVRLTLAEERHKTQLDDPKTDWDRLQGLLAAYREGDIPVARAYLHTQAAERTDRLLDLLEVWAAESRDPERRKEARAALYGLGR